MPSSHNFSAAVLAQPYIFTTFGVVALQDSVPRRIRAREGGKMTSPAPAPILLAIRAGLRCSNRPICPPSCLLLLLPLALDTRRRRHRPPPHSLPPSSTAHVSLRRVLWRWTCQEQAARGPEHPHPLHRLRSSR